MSRRFVNLHLETADVERRTLDQRWSARARAKDVVGGIKARRLREGEANRLFVARFQSAGAQRAAVDLQSQTVPEIGGASCVVGVVMGEQELRNPVERKAVGRDVLQNLVGRAV